MDYNKLAQEIHEDQKKAGWYDEKRSDDVLILLIKSELFEAFEAYRANAKIKALTIGYLDNLLKISKESKNLFIERFKANVKDSFADELADITIRLLDFAGYKNLTLEWSEAVAVEIDYVLLNALIDLDCSLTNIYYSEEIYAAYIFHLILKVKAIADSQQIDLERHIKLKLAYNKTRSKRHGGKVV